MPIDDFQLVHYHRTVRSIPIIHKLHIRLRTKLRHLAK